MPETEVEFTLTEADLVKVKKAAAMLQLPDISVKSHGHDIMMSAVDKKNDTANTYGVKVGETDKEFDFHFKTEHLKCCLAITMLPYLLNLFQHLSIKQKTYNIGLL